jgi:hypothetical protein
VSPAWGALRTHTKDPRFQSDELEIEETAFLPVEISTDPEPEATFPTLPKSVPVRDACVRSGPRIEIVTTDGHRLTVEGDFDGDALARLLKGLVSWSRYRAIRGSGWLPVSQIRGHFPNDDAASKLLYLVLNQTSNGWKSPPREWFMAETQFAVMFGERFVI